MVYLACGIPSRVAAMKQELIEGVAVNPPNEYELEKAGYRELANFSDFKMPYAGVPHGEPDFSRPQSPRAGRLHDRPCRWHPVVSYQLRGPEY